MTTKKTGFRPAIAAPPKAIRIRIRIAIRDTRRFMMNVPPASFSYYIMIPTMAPHRIG